MEAEVEKNLTTDSSAVTPETSTDGKKVSQRAVSVSISQEESELT
jgi:hypothetical protein